MKIEKLSKKLADNLLYYHNNPEKRCHDSEMGTCRYSGKTFGLDTPGCFIGRLLPAKNRELLDKMDFGSFQDVEISGGRVIKNFPKYMLDNVDLMTKFQSLHDNPNNWSIIGLNEDGKDKLKSIIKQFNLVEEDFNPILLKSELEVLVETINYYTIEGNSRSVDFENEVCVYNGPNGSKCAFSRVAKDDFDFSDYEDKAASEVLNSVNTKSVLKPEYQHLTDVSFWNSLQRVHDTNLDAKSYKTFNTWYNNLKFKIENDFSFKSNDTKKALNYLDSIKEELENYYNKTNSNEK